MLKNLANEQSLNGAVSLRKHLKAAALNNIMGSIFGKRYDPTEDAEEFRVLKAIVKEGFELLGAFNWSDYLPWLSYFYDPSRIVARCEALVPRVRKLVKAIIEQHQLRTSMRILFLIMPISSMSCFLWMVMRSSMNDMIAVLWEMIFRGTDTVALLTEWVMAELVLHPEVQAKLRQELKAVVEDRGVVDADMPRLSYLQAVVKEVLRLHPPGPLLSWARLSTEDVCLSNGMVIPANTTAMVNMWAITHDGVVWDDPHKFMPERFVAEMGGVDVDIRGRDLRLAPFGAGRRVCPGKNLGLATVALWVAKLVDHFDWAEDKAKPVDFSEVLKLSCEMKHPLSAVAIVKKDVMI
ncbi:cytochrome [Sesamum angolense]|uniref:Cytochrome n=2 Tax=Sesamum angolense TaxID=2727404 RepID=A0AAE1T8P9_9LAMI|nr:cytochrome [Sesamum angolense]